MAFPANPFHVGMLNSYSVLLNDFQELIDSKLVSSSIIFTFVINLSETRNRKTQISLLLPAIMFSVPSSQLFLFLIERSLPNRILSLRISTNRQT